MGLADHTYDSTGAGEMVKSDQSQFMHPISTPGGGSVINASAGDIPGIGQNMAPSDAPRSTPPSGSGEVGGMASDGGNQRIPS